MIQVRDLFTSNIITVIDGTEPRKVPLIISLR